MSEDQAHYPPVDPVRVGLRGRCPRCGQGALFDGLLKLRPRCAACGLDFAFADSGDGPAVFVMLIAGFLILGLALWLQITYDPPLWLQALLWLPLTTIICLTLLRLFKGVLIALQYRNKAAEGRWDRNA
ncbi:DUF983 domain-containing protein [Pseudohoeflea coraliihabitans]|uniref:DUF983 domain-containing protein n=1 Tax=Pseudohoeflea coraliihabitans TaxID=2860393 RepID=A0ABS6WLW5_9HYPH|nr:DUF983 domain-containing protein [Pseudohoeflea sp. DP4N28-3]MBW3096932.1 DUF983 domain-containing protein [Pseudohoeflea sp. DP4N28-3]